MLSLRILRIIQNFMIFFNRSAYSNVTHLEDEVFGLKPHLHSLVNYKFEQVSH